MRVARLQARLTEPSGYIPHTADWFAYWEDQLDRALRREPAPLIPLEFCDALLARTAQQRQDQ